MAKPSASSIAGASVSSSRIVPYSESASAIASRTAGIVAASGPFGSIEPFASKREGTAARGAVPWPLMTTTFRVAAS